MKERKLMNPQSTMTNIDIIIPIYNAFDFVKKCIETVIEHTDLTQHTLLLVNDKSTDERILPLLNSFIKENQSLNIILIDNKDNQGFVRTVNIGMQYSHHDVVLLNSDTEVTRNWLSKIQNCAYSKPAVATVTPLSNNATLASVPVFLAENTIPPGLSVEEYADIVEKCSMNLFPDIPTAHGFCMYIKREAIDDLGLFDEETFGKDHSDKVSNLNLPESAPPKQHLCHPPIVNKWNYCEYLLYHLHRDKNDVSLVGLYAKGNERHCHLLLYIQSPFHH